CACACPQLRESLGMAEGASMPNLLGTAPLIPGFGTSAGAPRIAPEYAARMPALALPAPRATPLFTQGTLIARRMRDRPRRTAGDRGRPRRG
ncbi:MAG: hypothetical protein ACREBE_15840, partial [bacterium]